MDYDMELKIRNVVSKYRKRKAVGCIIVILAILYLVYLGIFKMDYRVELVLGGWASFLLYLSVFAVYLVLAFAGLLAMVKAGEVIADVLADDCDPYLYEACLGRVSGAFYRDRTDCNRAMAVFYQGGFDRAFEILQRINVYKLKGGFRYNYYSLMSSIYFKRGLGMRVTELEQAYRTGMKKNKRDQRYFQMLCLNNNILRAIENKDYKKAFEFLSELEKTGIRTARLWNKVGVGITEAKIYDALGEKESAALKLEYVIKNGGRLYYVGQAQEMLKNYNEIKEESTNEEIYGGV